MHTLTLGWQHKPRHVYLLDRVARVITSIPIKRHVSQSFRPQCVLSNKLGDSIQGLVDAYKRWYVV